MAVNQYGLLSDQRLPRCNPRSLTEDLRERWEMRGLESVIRVRPALSEARGPPALPVGQAPLAAAALPSHRHGPRRGQGEGGQRGPCHSRASAPSAVLHAPAMVVT